MNTMNTMKKMMSLLLVLAMVLTMVGMLSGCKDDEDKGSENNTDPTGSTSGSETPSTEKGTYTVVVKSIGGMAMEGLTVYVYTDDTKTEIEGAVQTDADGKATFSIPKSEDYAIEIQGAPLGYDVKDSYTFTGNTANITLTSFLITEDSIENVNPNNAMSTGDKKLLDVGDVMYDLDITTVTGESIKLSDVLKEKDVVLLNFFYTTCGPCVNEFPYMHEAYQTYQDDVEVIALNSYAADDANSVAAFQTSMGLTFPMAKCPVTWFYAWEAFDASSGQRGYPTTIVVDRYGVICLVEVGGMPSLTPFTSIFEHFTGDDYEQKLLHNGVEDIVVKVKPNVDMPSSEEIGAVINNGDFNVTFRGEEGEDAEYSWPFVITEKNGESCVMASNKGIEGSYAIMYADIELKAGQAVGLDYLSSCEFGSDVLHIIVNDEPIFSISGADEVEKWQSCYPVVAETDGVYTIAFAYIKDSADSAGDDTVYVKNLRIVDADDIDVPTYLPLNAATPDENGEYEYVEVFLNEKDGYYHVGSKNGPLLLAVLMDYSEFSEETTIWDLAYNGDLTQGGHNYYTDLEPYFSYTSNSALSGVCTVNEELAGLLKTVADIAGFDGTENEWLKMCKYYESYGTDKELQDPIAGLAWFSAYEAKVGNNSVTYDRVVMPRGFLNRFVPTQSGVYRITSKGQSVGGIEGWIVDRDWNELTVFEGDERMYTDTEQVSIVYYMEAGQEYYIDICFWDMYEMGTIDFTIKYEAKTMDLFRLASPGYFTYDPGATGEDMYHTISGGIDITLGNDGYYYEDLGNGKLGSKLYCDFTGVTSVFNQPIHGNNGYEGLIELGAFDFRYSEYDLEILGYLEDHDGDKEATIAYLKELWGEMYDTYSETYQVSDVLAGRYHGIGEDMTEDIKAYIPKIYNGSATERVGCVAVDEELAEILQLLMDKYTFEGVDYSWGKLCYYYDYLGPEA